MNNLFLKDCFKQLSMLPNQVRYHHSHKSLSYVAYPTGKSEIMVMFVYLCSFSVYCWPIWFGDRLDHTSAKAEGPEQCQEHVKNRILGVQHV